MEHLPLPGPAMIPLNPQSKPVGRHLFHPHFTEGEMEGQRGKAMCPRSHSQEMVEQGLGLRQPGSGSKTLCDFWLIKHS